MLSRKYTKGRDLYDLAWYLSDPAWPVPNIPLLAHALEQSAWQGEAVTQSNWRRIIAAKVKTIDWQSALKDVSPFLERPEDAAWVSSERLLEML